MYSDILNELRTTNDRDTLILCIEEFLSKGVDSDKFNFNKLSDEEKNSKNLEKLISDLKKIEVVRLTLAIDPSRDFLEKIYQSLLNKIPEKFLIYFEIKKDILGGVIVVWKGKYCDLSVEKKINIYFKELNYSNA